MSAADAARTIAGDLLLFLLVVLGTGAAVAGIREHNNPLAFAGLGVAVVFALLLQSAATLAKLAAIVTALRAAKDAAKGAGE
jgi:hypothetical protein